VSGGCASSVLYYSRDRRRAVCLRQTGGGPPRKPLPRKKIPADLRSLARCHTEMGVKVLAGIASAEDAPPAARVAAVALLFDRGWGKALQPHVGDGGNGGITVVIRQLVDIVGKERPVLIEHESDHRSR
jgi:hypothetical protein